MLGLTPLKPALLALHHEPGNFESSCHLLLLRTDQWTEQGDQLISSEAEDLSKVPDQLLMYPAKRLFQLCLG